MSTAHKPLLLRILRSGRFWIYLAVTAVWLTVMTRLWLREHGGFGKNLGQMGISPEVLMVSWNDYEHWLWIEQNGRRIGLTTMNIAPVTSGISESSSEREVPGYYLNTRTRIDVRAVGLELPVEVATRVRMNTAFEMITLQAGIRAAGKAIRIQAFTENKFLFYSVKLDDDRTTQAPQPPGLGLALGALLGSLAQFPKQELCGRAPLAEPIFMSDVVIPVLMRSHTLKEGERWVTRASTPLTPNVELRITVEGKEMLPVGKLTVETWRFAEQLGTVRSTSWYDVRGPLVRCDTESGLRMTPATAAQVTNVEPSFRMDYPFGGKVNRELIRTHLDPRLDGKPLSELVPALPGL